MKNTFFLATTILFILIIISCGDEKSLAPETSSLKIISPTSIDKWEIDTECIIRWENNSGLPVQIDIYENDKFVLNVGTFAHIMTEYLYKVPTTLEPNSNYSLKLYLAEERETMVESETFTITPISNLPPVCEITHPRDGRYITIGDEVCITVAANDQDGQIVKVMYYIDEVFIGEVLAEPFEISWSTTQLMPGIHTITAVAVDNYESESFVSRINVVLTDGLLPIEMIMVPAGEFIMGSVVGDFDEMPTRRVFITKDYYVGKFETTNSQYCELLNYALEEGELTNDHIDTLTVKNINGLQRELLDLDDKDCEISFNGSEFVVDAGYEDRPVVEVTWWGAAFYCNMLSRKVKVMELYDFNDWSCNLFNGSGYRLPTEAEWEYAAKYNDGRRYPFGSEISSEYANYNTNIGATTDVGSFSPIGDSKLGICDMSGNAWEWTNDWYNRYVMNESFYVDPTGPIAGDVKVIRGGNFYSSGFYVRTTYRSCYNLHSGNVFGMRVILSIQ